jgi:hypothetical protein
VTDPPADRSTVSSMLPDPEAVQVPPPVPTQVHVTSVTSVGNVSTTVATVLLGPALLAVIVYVTDPPAVALVTPSVLVIDRSADWTIVSTSVARLFAGFGSVTPSALTSALLDLVPVADGLTVAVAV